MEQIKAYIFSYKPWLSILVIAIGVFIWIKLNSIIKKKFLKKGHYSKREGNIQLALSAVKYIVAILLIIFVLQLNGVNVSSLVAGIGVVGIVVGFALQDVLKDWVMGISIVWDKYFSVGDIVKYGDYEGTVVQFTLKTTKIKDIATGNLIIISNRNISQIERSAERFDILIPAPYELSGEDARAVLTEVAEKAEKADIIQKCKLLGTDEFAASEIKYRMQVFCHPTNKYAAKRIVLALVQDTYAEKGINIPYTHIDVAMLDKQ